MLKRNAKKLKVLPRYLIVCEGEASEGIYLNGVRRSKRIPTARITIELAAGVPLTVVNRALYLKEQNDAEARKAPPEKYEQVWCVFDCDDHPQLTEAHRLAAANSIKVAFCNPCFELFLLLHFCEYRKAEHRKVVTRKLKAHIPNYDKKFDFDNLEILSRYPDARIRCLQMNSAAQIAQGVPSAPFCSLPNLIDMILSMPTSPLPF